MRKTLILSLLACSILAGCGNSVNEDANATPPKQTEQNGQTGQTGQTEPGNGETGNNPSSNKDQQESGDPQSNEANLSKEEYTNKLDEVEKGLADLQELNDEGTTVSMTKAADETYKRWDAALNELYGELENQLSEGDMAELKQAQRKWITERDETAEKEAEKYKGGTMEALQLLSAKAQITKERCYELVDKYMK